MPDEEFRELYKLHRAADERLIYFLLAADGAAIGFALNQTQSAPLALSQIPLAFAVVCWGLSFFCGVRHLQYIGSNLYANMSLLEVQSGRHPLSGTNPQLIAAATKGINEAFEFNANRADAFATWHYRLLILGALSYIAWHIVEMYLRTIPQH